MRKKLLYAFLLTLALTACEKEIPVDYRQVEPLYVAEATMSQEGTKVVVSTTQDVTDNSRKRLNGTECILCMECKKACPKDAL